MSGNFTTGRDTGHFLYRGIHRTNHQVEFTTMREFLRSLVTREDIDLPVEVWRSFNRMLERGFVFPLNLHLDYNVWDLAEEQRFTQALPRLPTESWFGQLVDMICFVVEQPYGEDGSLAVDRSNYFQLKGDYLGIIVGSPKLGVWQVQLIPNRSTYDGFCRGGDRFFEAIPN